MIHILLVDDEPVLLDFGKMVLEQDPEFIIDATPSVSDALARIRENTYDVVVSDYQMPEMNGVDFLKEMRIINPRLPFILFTGKGNEGVVIEALNSGADFFLTKDPEPAQKLVELSQAIKLITSRYRTEKICAEGESRFRNIIENSTAGIVYTDLKGQYLFANQSFLDLLGYTLDELKGLSVQDITPAGDMVHEKNLRQDLFEGKRTGYRIQKQYLSKQNQKVWVDISVSILRDLQGVPIHFTGVIVDISNQKRMEKEIIESEQQLQALITFSPIGIAMVRRGQIEYVNQEMLRMFGYNTGIEMLQTPVINRISHEERDKILVFNWRRALGEPSGSSIETVGLRKNGSIFPISISTSSVEIDDLFTTIAFFQDISERKRAQFALEQVNKKLNLLSSITRHDIVNLLTAMLGYLGFVKDIGVEGEAAPLILKIDALARTIKRQIDFTRDYQDMGVSVAEWQDTMNVFNRAKYFQKINTISYQAQLSGFYVFADPLLEKVIYNLIDNAIRHGERVTTIRSSWYEDETGATWMVEDDGIGVPEAMKERIFSRGVGKNTGLGLFLVREILSITGISIKETGVEGEGSRFEMKIQKGGYQVRTDT